MTQDSDRLRRIAWLEIFPWFRLVRVPGEAFDFGGMLLAAVGLFAMWVGWSLLGAVFSSLEDPVAAFISKSMSLGPWEWPFESLSDPQTLDNVETVTARGWLMTQGNLAIPAGGLFSRNLSFLGFLFLWLGTVWSIFVWSIFGGAASRRAALRLTRGDRPSIADALRFGLKRWLSFFAGPMLPLTGCLVIALPLMLLGLFMRWDFGAAVGGILWPLAMLAGTASALLAVGLLLAWPLMWPTIGVEATDAFDSLSRAYSYLLHRPLRYLWYVVVAGFFGGLALLAIRFLVQQIVGFTLWGVEIGAGTERIDQLTGTLVGDQGALLNTANWLVRSWFKFVLILPATYAVSYFWAASVQIYLLLRRDEDGAELDEIFVEGNDAAFGLPPLKHDAAGVPGVDDPLPGQAPADPEIGS